MYHGFTDQSGQAENYHGKHLHVQTFKKHLQYLKKYYSLVSLEQFVQHCLTKTPIPNNAAILTFDDGYESNFLLAYPLLKEFNAPATIFLTTDFIEQKQFIWPNRIEYAILNTRHSILRLSLNGEALTFDLGHDEQKKDTIQTLKNLVKPLDIPTRNALLDYMEQILEQKLIFSSTIPAIHKPLIWEQIKEMAQSRLIDIGGHTCSHPILAVCPPEVMLQELTESKKIIEKRLNLIITKYQSR